MRQIIFAVSSEIQSLAKAYNKDNVRVLDKVGEDYLLECLKWFYLPTTSIKVLVTSWLYKPKIDCTGLEVIITSKAKAFISPEKANSDFNFEGIDPCTVFCIPHSPKNNSVFSIGGVAWIHMYGKNQACFNLKSISSDRKLWLPIQDGNYTLLTATEAEKLKETR